LVEPVEASEFVQRLKGEIERVAKALEIVLGVFG
jgi:hypothetical protein